METKFNFYEMYETVPKIKYDPENPKHAMYKNKDDALLPAGIIVNPDREAYNAKNELQRTVSGMAVTNKGRIYCSYFTSGEHQVEGNGAYDVILTSDDGGKTFENRLVIQPPVPESTWIFDISMMVDTHGAFHIRTETYSGFLIQDFPLQS